MCHSLLGLLLLLGACSDAQDPMKCFECTDVPHPSECTVTTECTTGQICVVEQFITSGGLILFNSGCQSKVRCNQGGKRDIPQYSTLSKRADIITCDECCEGDFCNDQGCGLTALKQPQRGPLCFQCPLEDSPHHCRHIQKCDLGEVCMLTQLREVAPDGGNLYKTDCATPQVCKAFALIGKKRNTYCHVCCEDDFCNDRCDELITPATTTSAPTTAAPTTTTTTLNTTPMPVTTAATKTATTTQMPASTPSTTTTQKPTTTSTTTPKPTTTSITTTTPKPTTTTMTTATSTTPTTTTKRLRPWDICRNHHYRYDAHSHLCYQFHYEYKTWDDANRICRQEGGTLAIIDTSNKWDALRNAIKHDHKYDHEERIFAGGKYTGHNKDFKWVDGTPVQFAAWAHGEPDGEPNGCIYLNRYENYNHERIFIGAHDLGPKDNSFFWPNGAKVSFTDWDRHEPDGGDDDCVYLGYDGNWQWYDKECNNSYMFICTIFFN